jgi:hypothetical protein
MDNKKDDIKKIKIVYPDLDEMPEDLYANNVRISHSKDDFVLYFAKIDTPPIISGETFDKEEIKAKVVARIRLTPTVVESMVRALKENFENYKNVKGGK